MTTYEDLLSEADSNNIITREKPLIANNGRIKGKRIAINNHLTETEKKCTMAEELGHYYTGSGDILDQASISNRKQELHGRAYAYNRLVGLMGIIDAYRHHCIGLSESAKYLEVTEAFLKESLIYYKSRYGASVTVDNYTIFFEPYIAVLELI
ncbi:MAG: ImmA/IrrE family metallo-endopeptidase [Candidatus Gastranaerophilales bacterium]|nr:ImmA/IrrE family metallo-endopeptidase [Candidatus Gastranaerophilales bacterium]